MSWVFIDTSMRGKMRVGLLSPTCTHIEEREGRVHILLSLLFRNVGRQAIEEAKGICVVAGPGSFSAIRSGVLVANLLARCFSLPLIGVSREQSMNLEGLVLQLEREGVTSTGFVQPVYDAEPNITISHV